MGYSAEHGTGEVCIQGMSVFAGYYGKEEMTKKVLDESSWLHTGDVGSWNRNGSLRIVGRKKNIYKLPNGIFLNVDYAK